MYFFSVCIKGSYCEGTQKIDDSIIIDIPSSSINNEINNEYFDTSDTESNITSNSSDDNFSHSNKNETSNITLEDYSITYFSRYLAYKCIKKFNCPYYKNNLLTTKSLNEKKIFFN